MSWDITRRSVSDEDYREFYCSARGIPDNILRKTLAQMTGRWEFVDTKDIAPVLYNNGLLTYGEFCRFTNVHQDQVDRMNTMLYKTLPSKGKEQYTLIIFYQCLLRCHVDRSIPTDLRAHALVLCGVDRPVLVPGISVSKTVDEILQQMLAKLTMYVPAEQAKDFAKSLNLSGNDLPDFTEIQLSELCQLWIEKKSHECTPEALVEALVCTMGLGKYASGIGAATNPPDVRSYFYNLQGKWWDMAAFLGYSKEDLDDVITEIHNSVQRQIAKFLTKFEMPDCGACTITILHKAGGKAGISSQTKHAQLGHGLNVPAGMKGPCYSMPMPMLETFDEQPKPKPAALNPPQLKPHGATLQSQYYHHQIPPPPLAAMASVLQVASVFASPPPPPWWGVHCHPPPQGQVPPTYGYPTEPNQEFFQTIAAHAQSFLEWQQTQYRGVESYEENRHGDSCASELVAPASNLSAPASSLSDQVSTTASSATHKPEYPSSEKPSQNDDAVANAPATNALAVARDVELPGFPRDDDNDLLKHCMKGDPEDIEIVATLMDSGASLKIQTKNDGSHPLHLAVLSKSFQMLSLLVPYYDSLDMIDVVRDDHKTALMLACKEKNYEFVRIMVEHTASVNSKDCDGLSCLHLKETLESPDIVQLLIDKGADVDILTDGSLLTPLTHACFLGLAQSIEILLDGGASPDGKPGVHTIIETFRKRREGHVQTVQVLLGKNANVNLQDQEGCTPLLKACKAGHVDVASKLITADADKNLPDKGGNFPVLVAVDSNNTELLQFLLACKADVNQFKVIVSGDPPREYEVAPLTLAAGRGKLDVVEILVENKANVNYASQRTVSALTYAVGGGHAHVVEYLLKVNDMIRTIDVLYLPLLLAVKSDEQFILKMLLDALDGYEKALRDANDAGMQDLVEALTQLDEMGRRKSTDHEAASGTSTSNSSTLEPWNPRHMRECVDHTLVEFTKAAVKTAEKEQGRSCLVNDARTKGHEHIAFFFEEFFANPDAGPEMFAEFINVVPCPSPAIFIFENKDVGYCSKPQTYIHSSNSGTFKNILDEMNSNVIEYLPMALMQIPGFEESKLDGETLMQLLFGKRFFQAVQCLNLLEAALPALASNHAAIGIGMPAQQQNKDHSQHGVSEDADRDSCSPTYGDRAWPPDCTNGVTSPVGDMIHSEASEVAEDSADDDNEVQGIETAQNLAVESHSHWEESSASLTEQKDEGRLLEAGELHNAHPMPPNDSGHVKLVVSDFPAESKLTVAEQTGRLKLSRTKSLPATSKTKIPQRHVSPRATKQPPSFVHPNTDGIHESKIPRRIGNKENKSKPLRSTSEGGESHIPSSIPASYRNVRTTPNSTRRMQKPMHSKSSIAQGTSAATVAAGNKHSTPNRGVIRKPQQTVCGLNICDTPITNAEKLFEFYSRRIVRWQHLAKYLNVHDSEIERINRTYRLEEEKCFQMLYSWSKSAHNRATYGRLAEGFREIEQEYLIKDLHSRLTTANSYKDTTMEYEIDLKNLRETWGATSIELTQVLDKKQTEGFTTARIQVKLEQ